MIERSNVTVTTQKRNTRLQGIMMYQVYEMEANTPVGVGIIVGGDLKCSIAPNVKTRGYSHGYYQHGNGLFSFCCYIAAYFISKMNLLV